MLVKALCVSSPGNTVIEHNNFPPVWWVCCGRSTAQLFTSIPEVKQPLRNSIHFALYDFLLHRNSYQFSAIFLSLQNERSDTFHRQQGSRDSRKPLSCLPFSSFHSDRCSPESGRQDSGHCRNIRSLKISPDTWEYLAKFPYFGKSTFFFFFFNNPSLGSLCTNRTLLDVQQHLRKWVRMMLIQQILQVFFPINDKAASVELNPSLHFLPWFALLPSLLSGCSTGKLWISLVVSQETAILCTGSFSRVASSPECTAMSLS